MNINHVELLKELEGFLQFSSITHVEFYRRRVWVHVTQPVYARARFNLLSEVDMEIGRFMGVEKNFV